MLILRCKPLLISMGQRQLDVFCVLQPKGKRFDRIFTSNFEHVQPDLVLWLFFVDIKFPNGHYDTGNRL